MVDVTLPYPALLYEVQFRQRVAEKGGVTPPILTPYYSHKLVHIFHEIVGGCWFFG